MDTSPPSQEPQGSDASRPPAPDQGSLLERSNISPLVARTIASGTNITGGALGGALTPLPNGEI